MWIQSGHSAILARWKRREFRFRTLGALLRDLGTALGAFSGLGTVTAGELFRMGCGAKSLNLIFFFSIVEVFSFEM